MTQPHIDREDDVTAVTVYSPTGSSTPTVWEGGVFTGPLAADAQTIADEQLPVVLLTGFEVTAGSAEPLSALAAIVLAARHDWALHDAPNHVWRALLSAYADNSIRTAADDYVRQGGAIDEAAAA
ncbi:hypothetical protein [Leifsonia sp. fls2-241-R2A-40a]|uniref:hypothetical protein n=1 Tax=Leifsonia sp. fls2-241-R2A-40a TaxID=3040290 RepID=UPI00254C6EA4|nr:hypothetical protein [Leifsonia sp. fls2-241-R2A-40a]